MSPLTMFLGGAVGMLALSYGFGKSDPLTLDEPASIGWTTGSGGFEAMTGTEAGTTGMKEKQTGKTRAEIPDRARERVAGGAFHDSGLSGSVVLTQLGDVTGSTLSGKAGMAELQDATMPEGILVQPGAGPLEMSFSEDIRLGSGQIQLFVYDGKDFVLRNTFDVSDSGGTVTVSENRLSIRLPKPLDILKEYAVHIGPDAIEHVSGAALADMPNGATFRFISDNGVDLPSIDIADYDTVIFGQTFNSTLKLDHGDDSTLLINNVFENIDGNALELRNVSNVTIYDCEFSEISGTAIRLRSSGSTENVSIISNTFNDIGRNAISASKRYKAGVDHIGLNIVGNDIGDTGYDSDNLAHAIYVQSSAANISGNAIVGKTDANAISVRGDGIVWDNYINVRSMDRYGSGIKYYADHLSGDSRTLVIADNQIEGSDLYSGIEIKANPSSIPTGFSEEEWIVNNFYIARNSIGNVRNPYVIDRRIGDADWSLVEVLDWSSVPAFPSDLQSRGQPRFRRIEAD